TIYSHETHIPLLLRPAPAGAAGRLRTPGGEPAGPGDTYPTTAAHRRDRSAHANTGALAHHRSTRANTGALAHHPTRAYRSTRAHRGAAAHQSAAAHRPRGGPQRPDPPGHLLLLLVRLPPQRVRCRPAQRRAARLDGPAARRPRPARWS